LDVSSYNSLGETYLKTGEYDNAIKAFENVVGCGGIKTDLTDIGIGWRFTGHNGQTVAALKKGDYDSAIYHSSRVIDDKQAEYLHKITAYKNRAAAYEAQGDTGKANADLAEAERLQKEMAKKEAASKRRNLIIGLVIAAVIIGLIIKCAVG
jgi:tetratricopeptide (TPR) repeat protein